MRQIIFVEYSPPQALINRMAKVALRLTYATDKKDYDKTIALAYPLWQEIKQHPDNEGVMPAIIEFDNACKAALSRIAGRRLNGG